MSTKIETRSVGGILKPARDATKFELRGYAAVFNSLSKNLGGFRETITRGAFARSLKAGDDVRALFNHDKNHILGRRGNGTLDVAEDERGLKFCMRLNPESESHQEIYRSVQRGDISECSFAFTVPDGGDELKQVREKDEKGNDIIAHRILKNVNLLDVSVVTYPAYNTTSVSARSADYMADWYADALLRARIIGMLVERDIKILGDE